MTLGIKPTGSRSAVTGITAPPVRARGKLAGAGVTI
jgi:hypothetical protein